MTTQEPPFAVQLEPTEGCSLACSFCGIQSIRDNGADADLAIHGKNSAPYRFMGLDVVNRVAVEAKRLGWNPRWEFAMHGEPTMNTMLDRMVNIVRGHHPKGYIMVTSNGSGLLGPAAAQKVQTLFDAGLNTLALDEYKHADFIPRLRRAISDTLTLASDIGVYNYPAMPEGNPHKRHNSKKLVFINDISENSDGNHQLTNQGGNSFRAERESLNQRCAKPFRELSVRWDGNVALCCDDWKGEYKIGNVLEMPLDQLWNHRYFDAARRELYAGNRAFGPCAGCNVRTYRNGLLPDKYGKQPMPAPTTATRAALLAAGRGKVFTIKLAKGD